MDLDAVKLLLEAHERAFKSALEVVVDQLKEKIQKTEGTVTDLIKSLEFSQSEIVDLKNQVKVLQQSNTEKQKCIEGLRSTINELQQRVNYQEDYSRRNNIRITGLQEQRGETWEQTCNSVSKLLEETLQLPSLRLERAHRVGPINPSRPRTIVARFEKYGDREAVSRNARKLKGTGIYIDDDLCSASQELKRNQLPLLKQARQDGKIAYFRHTKLIIRDREANQTYVPHSTSPGGLSAGGSKSAGHGAVGGGAMDVRGPAPQSGFAAVVSEGAAAWPTLRSPPDSAVGIAGELPSNRRGSMVDEAILQDGTSSAGRAFRERKKNHKK